MALIQTSDLSQRIDFIKDTTVKDEDGQLVTTPETVFSCWACVQTQRLSDVKASIGTVLEGTLSAKSRTRKRHESALERQNF